MNIYRVSLSAKVLPPQYWVRHPVTHDAELLRSYNCQQMKHSPVFAAFYHF